MEVRNPVALLGAVIAVAFAGIAIVAAVSCDTTQDALNEAEVCQKQYRIVTDLQQQKIDTQHELIVEQEALLDEAYAQIEELSRELIPFPSVQTLRDFLAADPVSTREYIVNDYDCDDFSMDLVSNAHAAGYIMYPEITTRAEGNHMMCWTIVDDNYVFLIEPQNDGIEFFDIIDPIEE